MSLRVSLIEPEINPPPEAWERVVQVLRGGLRPMLDARALQVLKLIKTLPCDVRVRPGCFEMWPARGGRHQYLSELAAPVLHHLLRRIGLSQIAEARVGLIERVGLGAKFGKPTLRAVWLVPAPEETLVFLRDAPARRGPRMAMSVPADGPWALPAPYAHAEPSWISALRACPRCGSRPPHFRELSTALVCPACGRSFDRRSLGPVGAIQSGG